MTHSAEKFDSLKQALAETRRLIRLRHYAYRTEQTYLGWLSQYDGYVQKHRLPWAALDRLGCSGEA